MLHGWVLKAVLVIASFAGLVGCSESESPASTSSGNLVEQAALDPTIAPDDFVFAPCDLQQVSGDCVILAAGGKRVLIGAPAGIGEGKIAGDNIRPDSVILTSLKAQSIEGLDEVRNRSWLSGRRSPLVVAGVTGTKRVVAALNDAYITSDALAYVNGTRRGGFDIEAMIAVEVEPGEEAFDTGDLTITALEAGIDQLALWIDYRGETVLLSDCAVDAEIIAAWPVANHYIGCSNGHYIVESRVQWPLERRSYISK